jgi:hypothetical protein
MKNVTVVIGTTFALLTTAMAVEIAQRHASVADVVRASDTVNASADARLNVERSEAMAPPPAAAQTAPLDAISRPAPMAASEAAPVVEKRSEAEPAPAAITAAATLAAPAERTPAKLGEAGDGTAANAKTAVVKPVLGKPQSVSPVARKPAMEKASAAEPAPAPPAARPAAKPHVARAHGFGRDAEEPARALHYARWLGGDGARLRPGPDAYGFSGSFGGCQYHGVVSVTGYRIEKSC